MTQSTETQVPSEVLSLAQLLTAHPQARKALQLSIERQQQAREVTQAMQERLNVMACPHCGAPGIVYLTLPTAAGVKEFKRKPMDCCQEALRDAAEHALHYAMNPNNDPVERLEAADRYAALKESITAKNLLTELETHELLLASIEERVSGLPTSQGGQK